VDAARAAIQSALRDWISNAVVQGEVIGSIVHFKGGCLTSSKPIEAPVRDAMITAGAPALLAVSVASYLESTWRNWASQLRAIVIAFPEFEAYPGPSAERFFSAVPGFPLSTLQSPGNSLFAYSTFAGQLRDVAAPYFPSPGSSSSPVQAQAPSSQQHQAIAAAATSAGNRKTSLGARMSSRAPQPQIFAGVLQTGTSPLDLFAGLGAWFSSCFDDWFLGAGIGRLFATATGVSLTNSVNPPFKMYGRCEGPIEGRRRFGDRA